MLIPKEPRIVDKAYRDSASGRCCENCRGERCNHATVVGAHPRAGHAGGTGLKPDDRLLLFLGMRCHAEQENGGVAWLARFLMESILHLPWPRDEPNEMECLWLVRHQLHPMLIRRYEIWKMRR